MSKLVSKQMAEFYLTEFHYVECSEYHFAENLTFQSKIDNLVFKHATCIIIFIYFIQFVIPFNELVSSESGTIG